MFLVPGIDWSIDIYLVSQIHPVQTSKVYIFLNFLISSFLFCLLHNQPLLIPSKLKTDHNYTNYLFSKNIAKLRYITQRVINLYRNSYQLFEPTILAVFNYSDTVKQQSAFPTILAKCSMCSIIYEKKLDSSFYFLIMLTNKTINHSSLFMINECHWLPFSEVSKRSIGCFPLLFLLGFLWCVGYLFNLSISDPWGFPV